MQIISPNNIDQVFKLSSSALARINNLKQTLPNSAPQIAKIALECGHSQQRLACCIKLLEMYRNSIPIVSLTASEKLNVDKTNPNFESNFNPSQNYPSKSITTIFSCALAAIGTSAARKYSISPSDINPFVQCYRIFFRLTWYLYCRHEVIKAIQTQNQIATLYYSLYLVSYPEFSYSAQHAALMTAISQPKNVDAKLLAYLLPRRFLSDVSQPLYQELKECLPREKKEQLAFLEDSVDALLSTKETHTFFSSVISIEDSLVASLTHPLDEIRGSPYRFYVPYFLYEINPTIEIKKFAEKLLNSSKIASTFDFHIKRKKFDLIYFVQYEEPPKSEKEKFKSQETNFTVQRKNVQSKPQKVDFSNLFKKSHNFIGETQKLTVV